MWDWNTPVEDYLAGMAEGVKVGKIRQIGIANCFAWQLAEANAIAKENGWGVKENLLSTAFSATVNEPAPYCVRKVLFYFGCK